MTNKVMQKEVIEMYRNKFVLGKGAGMIGGDMIQKRGSECILFCKRATPNIFNIKDGFAIVPGAQECFNDGVCMISNFTKVVLVFDHAKVRR